MMPLPDFLIFSFATLFVNAVLVTVSGVLAYKTNNDLKSLRNKRENNREIISVADPNRDIPTPTDRIPPKYIDDETAARIERQQIEDNKPKGFGK